jgi:endonuclease/exonuclease/phosphatase family metal-dependent hydrolase
MKRKTVWLAAAALAALGIALMLSSAPISERRAATPLASDRLELLIWNIGYAGLGAESDFIADGGKSFLPPSARIVRKNLAGIEKTLRASAAGVIILPEAARGTPLTWWIDVLGALDKALPGRERIFSADVLTKYLPWPFRFEHGVAIYSRNLIGVFSAEPLPLEPAQAGGLYQRAYSARIVRLPVEGKSDWGVIAVHLAAFDENAAVRRSQLAAVFELAKALHGEGVPVIIGGDFNLTLADTSFPNTTSAEDRAWVQPFPRDLLPAGWQIVTDPTAPSVRTNERAYKPGQNYTGIVDGYIVSPDVWVEKVETLDQKFQFADHQPVRLIARRAP